MDVLELRDCGIDDVVLVGPVQPTDDDLALGGGWRGGGDHFGDRGDRGRGRLGAGGRRGGSGGGGGRLGGGGAAGGEEGAGGSGRGTNEQTTPRDPMLHHHYSFHWLGSTHLGRANAPRDNMGRWSYSWE